MGLWLEFWYWNKIRKIVLNWSSLAAFTFLFGHPGTLSVKNIPSHFITKFETKNNIKNVHAYQKLTKPSITTHKR